MFAANCTQVTTTERTGLQELALDVEKNGCAVEQRLEEDKERKWSNDKSRLHTHMHAELKVEPQNDFSERVQPPPLSLPTASSTRGALPFAPPSRR